MDEKRWRRLQTLFEQAIEYDDVEERLAFVQSASCEDEELRHEVLRMLRADQRSAAMMDDPASAVFTFLMDDASMQLSSSTLVGPYRLERCLGEGGMGAVWLANRPDTGAKVAIKFLLHARISPARRSRFVAEIKMLARLKHENIARLYDAGALEDGTPWFAMEYVDGLSLAEYCSKRNLGTNERLVLLLAVCEAVRYAHSQEIIHRDLKPSNILVEANGVPKLLDFGIARQTRGLDWESQQTQPGLRMMTPEYAAPEWVADGTLGFFTDVYSLGVILSELLREGGKNTDLHRLIEKAVQPDYQQRYFSIDALASDIQRYLKREPLTAYPPSLSYSVKKFVARNTRSVILTASACLVLVSLFSALAWKQAQAQRAILAGARRTEAVEAFMLEILDGGDKAAGPAHQLQVATLLDRGVEKAAHLTAQPDIQAEIYRTLGRSFERIGDFPKARKLLTTALSINRSTNPSSQTLGEMKLDLGEVDLDLADFANAERAASYVLTAAKESVDASLLRARANWLLGRVEYERNQIEQAKAHFQTAVSMQQSKPAAMADLADSFAGLSDCHLRTGDYPKTIEWAERSLAVHKKLYGDVHPAVAGDLGNIGNAQSDLGKFRDAEASFRRAHAIYSDYYGVDHPLTAAMLSYVGQSLMYQERYTEAEELLDQALKSVERTYGISHPKVALVLSSLTGVHLMLKKWEKGIAEAKRAYEIYRSFYGEEHPYTIVALANLASAYNETKNYRQAEALIRKAIALFSKVQSPTNLNTGVARMKLGRALFGQRRIREALSETSASYSILTKVTALDNGFIQADRRDFIREYMALGKLNDAARFRKELQRYTH